MPCCQIRTNGMSTSSFRRDVTAYNMETNYTPLEVCEIAKSTVKFFHWTLPVLDTFSNLN
jgi:hypothetical protein